MSPSIVGLSARMISPISSRSTRSTSEAISISPGPMPSIGDIMPPKTWYSPRYCWVFSIAITSRMFSTTHIVLVSRCASEHIGQMSVSLMLWHTLQYFTLWRKVPMALVKPSTLSSLCRKRCSTSLSAVLRPIPGSLENSETAFSNRVDGYCCSTAINRQTGKRRYPP